MENPLVWQAELVAILKKLAADMGWMETSKEYKYELKRIHLQAKGEDASADTEAKVEKISCPPFKGWVKGESGKFKDKDAARVGRLAKMHAGRWINDKNCPNSEAEEGAQGSSLCQQDGGWRPVPRQARRHGRQREEVAG